MWLPTLANAVGMLKIVKDSVLRVSRSMGYDIVPLREMKERDFALHLGELLAHLKIDCVLDVGANVGQYRDFLRDKVLFDGIIISFEPVSHFRFDPSDWRNRRLLSRAAPRLERASAAHCAAAAK